MTNIKLKKISDFEFFFEGTIDKIERKIKTVEVNGEIYKKENIDIVEININEIDKSEFCKILIDFPFFNLNYLITDLYDLSLIQLSSDRILSTNDYIAAYQLLFNNNFLDKRIIRIYTMKDKINYFELIKDFNIGMIPICLCSYGFNNYLYCEITLKDFLSIEDKKSLIDYDIYKRVFNHFYNVDINENLNIDNVLKIMKGEIN